MTTRAQRILPALVGSLAPLSGLLLADPAFAAGVVGAEGASGEVTVETAWVIWHPDTRIEHLIVGARLDHARDNLAYLIPVPSRPIAQPVGADLTGALAGLLREYRARAPGWEVPSILGGAPRSWIVFGTVGAADSSVHDLVHAGSFEEMLAGHGYRADAALREWATSYAEAGSHLVAVHDRGSGPQRALPFVRIQFESKRPYFPYREPARPADDVRGGTEPGTPHRLLRLNVVTTERVSMRLGESMPSLSQAWLSFEPTQAELRHAFGDELAAQLGIDQGKRYWLTSFEDYHRVRPGNDDVWFERLAEIPKDGAPGTVGDRDGAGIALTPLGPPDGSVVGAPGVGTAGAGSSTNATVMARRVGRRGRMALLFGGLVVMAAAAWAWANSKIG